MSHPGGAGGTVRVLVVDPLATTPGARALFEASVRVQSASLREAWGPDAADHSAAELTQLAGRLDFAETHVAALLGEDVVGWGRLVVPRRENLAHAQVFLGVAPTRTRRGIGTALLHALERHAADRGVTVLRCRTERPNAAARAADLALGLAAAPGTFDGDAGAGPATVDSPGVDPAAAFLRRHGWRAHQEMLRSDLLLPLDDGLVDRVAGHVERSGRRGGGRDRYIVELLRDVPAPAWWDGIADLHRRLSTDAPHGGLALEEEDWDAARVERHYRAQLDAKSVTFTALAQEIATGALVGYSEVSVSAQTPAIAYQHDTLVLSEHRGRRLGLALKLATALTLARELPGVAVVRTWQAADNTPMCRVNAALGFRVAGIRSEWIRRLGEPAPSA